MASDGQCEMPLPSTVRDCSQTLKRAIDSIVLEYRSEQTLSQLRSVVVRLSSLHTKRMASVYCPEWLSKPPVVPTTPPTPDPSTEDARAPQELFALLNNVLERLHQPCRAALLAVRTVRRVVEAHAVASEDSQLRALDGALRIAESVAGDAVRELVMKEAIVHHWRYAWDGVPNENVNTKSQDALLSMLDTDTLKVYCRTLITHPFLHDGSTLDAQLSHFNNLFNTLGVK